MHRHGGAREASSQDGGGPGRRIVVLLATLAVCLLPGLSAGCRPAPEGPRPPRIPTEQATLDAASAAPDPGIELRRPADRAGFDIAHYRLELDLSRPAAGEFGAVATLRGELGRRSGPVDLDFIGLEVAAVTMDGRGVEFGRGGSVLTVGPFEAAAAEVEREIRIEYGGAPENGLFFGEDRNGEPAVFADNWPNRARWWFPSNDHPLDKATARFEVLAPEGYEVIANGRLVETRPEAEGGTVWVWETDPGAPIPSYTMVVGMARFERRPLGGAGCGLSPAAPRPEGGGETCAAVSVWALAGDGDYGAERFSRAPDMLDFYTELIGPYPYEKLAHVESSTRFGGMGELERDLLRARSLGGAAHGREGHRARDRAPVVRRRGEPGVLEPPVGQRGVRELLQPALLRGPGRDGGISGAHAREPRGSRWGRTSWDRRSSTPAPTSSSIC